MEKGPTPHYHQFTIVDDGPASPKSPLMKMQHTMNTNEQVAQGGTGFEGFQAILKRILSRMDRSLSLNERWHLLGTFIEGYTYDQDAATLSQKCTEVLTGVAKDCNGKEEPSVAMTAVGCVVFDRLVGWIGHRHPSLLSVLQAVRGILYDALFMNNQETGLQDSILNGDLLGPDILPLALSVYSEDTYFEEIRYRDSLKSQVKGVPSDAEARYEALSAERDELRSSYTKTLFTAWRSTTHKEKHTQAEFRALRERLADLEAHNETRTLEMRDRIAKLEKENEGLQRQIRQLNQRKMSETSLNMSTDMTQVTMPADGLHISDISFASNQLRRESEVNGTTTPSKSSVRSSLEASRLEAVRVDRMHNTRTADSAG